MSKPRVRFAEGTGRGKTAATEEKRRRMNEDAGQRDEDESITEPEKKHTLDSDEEDDGQQYQKLDIRNVEGQEDATDEYDGGTKIMAFNMKEDMEEGHFDKDGTFIYNKKENNIKDAWLDNINWENVKDQAGKHWKPQEKDDQQDSSGDEGDKPATSANGSNLEAVYTRILELLNNKETIAAALKRLNSEKGLSAAEERKRRWAAKKAGTNVDDNHAKTVAEITALADKLISLGHMEAYQLDSARIIGLLDKLKKPEQEHGKEAAFDMFGDSLPDAGSTSKGAEEEKPTALDPDSAALWEYRFKDDVDSKIIGPISTSAMAGKQQSEEFEKRGAFARRVGTEAFYDVKRIDFDLFE